MAENKKKSTGTRAKSGNKNTKNKKNTASVKKVGKNKQLELTFFQKHANAIMFSYIFAAFLLVCFALIPGYNIWQKFRAGLFSCVGFGFFLIVAEVVVVSVRLCLKNLKRSLLITNLSGFSLAASFCGIVHLFNFGVDKGGFDEWKNQLFAAAERGWDFGMGTFEASGGILGALFGGTPLHLFGKAGAFIVLILLFLVSLFFYLNTDINLLGDKLSEAAMSGREKLESTNEHRKIRADEKKRERFDKKQARMEKKLGLEDLEEDKEESDADNYSFNDDDFEVKKTSVVLPVITADSAVKHSETAAFEKDAFDFNETEIEYDPISSKESSVSDKVKKHIFPQNNVFTYPEGEKPQASTVKNKPSKPFAADLISMGGAGASYSGQSINALPDDFEEIEDNDDLLQEEAAPVAAKAISEEIKLSDNDKKVVKEAAKDAETKLEKTKSEVKNYKETRKIQKAYKLPSIEFLNKPSFGLDFDSEAEMRVTAKKLVDVLKSFGVETKLIGASRGPSVTRYELSPAPGVKISRITSLADDIALGLASTDVRIEAPIPNKAAVGIEVPNKNSSMVTLREVISSKEYKDSQGKLLTVALGKDIAGNIRCTDLAKMPHLLIAGTTGSGKSVCLNCMIASVLYNATPEQVKLLMIDPKQVEFSVYNGIPHLLVPVITDARKAAGSLAWAVGEMDSRYKTFSTCGVRDIKSYNNYILEHPELPFMPQIVIFIDELNDLMMVSPKEVEDSICRLAQKARAAGMHLVVATQRPSVDVITGIIKANIPSRLSLAVSSQVDSRTILDSVGAEKLLGNGDMLFNPVGVSKPVRIQGAYLSDGEIEKIVGFIKNQGAVSYDDDIMQEIEKNATADKKKGGNASGSADSEDSQLDALIEDAMNVVTELNSASTTVIQRKLSVGYARAARIMDQLEQLGYVSPAEGNKPRKVLITRAQFLEMKARGEEADEDYDVLSD